MDLESLRKELLAWPSVRVAYIDRPTPDPLVSPADDPRSPDQGYLDPAPDGIDAEYAWGVTGGDGAGQSFIDLERGWTFDHEDLDAHGASLLHGTLLNTSRAHGTAVLGQVCSVDNTLGCVGIVPNVASVRAVSYHMSTRPDAVFAALDNLVFGDVLLLEAQVTVDGASLLGPIEGFDLEYDAIRLATALGVIVIEAGGNGTNNGFAPPLAMDTFIDPMGRNLFNPASVDFRDSGAIIVTRPLRPRRTRAWCGRRTASASTPTAGARTSSTPPRQTTAAARRCTAPTLAAPRGLRRSSPVRCSRSRAWRNPSSATASARARCARCCATPPTARRRTRARPPRSA